MRRFLISLVALLIAAAASAAPPYFLDRSGTLWRASDTPAGLVLTGERDGSEVVRSTVPFAIGFDGAADTSIQVAADEITGKVAVTWQRFWVEGVSEIFLAVWSEGSWERVVTLSADASTFPRFPSAIPTRVSSTALELDESTGEMVKTTVTESFLHVVWWEGVGAGQGAHYALVRFADDNGEARVVVTKALDDLLPLGLACTLEGNEAAIKHANFVSQMARDRALVLFGSFESCSLHLLEVRFQLGDSELSFGPENAPSTTVASRKRHMPIFGVTGTYQVPQNFSLDSARVVMGSDFTPVAYTVSDQTLEYVVFEGVSWSLARTLSVRDDLTLDQAIPLVEGLAR